MNFSSSYLIENPTLAANMFSPSVDNNQTLTDGTWYWRVEAINFAGAHGGYLDVRTFVIDVTPPTNPQPVSPPQSGATKVTYHTPFRWSLVPDAVSYWIQLDSTPGFGSIDVVTCTDLRGTNCIINDTLSYGVWYWRVVALDSAGNIDDFSSAPIRQFTVDTISPSQPTLRYPVEGYLTNQTTPRFAWYAASDPIFNGVSSGVVNYTFWLDNSSSFNSTNLRKTTGLNETGYTLPSALSDGTWHWFVNATDRAGNTGQGSITQSFTVDTVVPAPPPALSMSPNGGSVNVSKVTFSWGASSDSSGIEGYVIQIDASDKFDTTNRLEYRAGSGTTFTPDKEFPNGLFYWRVAAIDAAGNLGAWSDPVPFEVNFVVGLSPVMMLTIGGGSSGAVILVMLGFIFYRRARRPFIIKKIEQSLKLISKGRQAEPIEGLRSRTDTPLALLTPDLDSLGVKLKKEGPKNKGKKQEKPQKKKPEKKDAKKEQTSKDTQTGAKPEAGSEDAKKNEGGQ
jgi:hypothetical protein